MNVEPITTINPQRLAWCLTDLRLTAEAVAAETGLTADKLESVLDGVGSLTFAQLRTLAEYLGRSVLFLLDPAPVDAERVHSPQFRTLAGQKPELSRRVRQLVQRAERQRAVYLDLLDDLDGAERPRFDPPALPTDPATAARIAREWLALGEVNTFASYRAAVENKGILVFRTNGYAGKWQIAKESPILGFALYDEVAPIIVVKKQDAEARQSFTLMHELAHVLMHRISSVDDKADLRATRGMEREANQFAAHLLVPDTFLSQMRDAERPSDVAQLDEWLRPQRQALGVSSDVLLLRLVDAGRVPLAVYEGFCSWREEQPQRQGDGGSGAYRYRKPGHVFGDRFVRTVLGALGARLITLSRASDYLDGLKVEDLHKLERHYAGA